MPNTDQPKKRGAPKKEAPLDIHLGLRIPPKLEEWLIDEGRKIGVGKGTAAKILLMQLMEKQKGSVL